MLHITGEIMYNRPDGRVHSDMCFTLDDVNGDKKEEVRKFLHDSLDEWINNQSSEQNTDMRVNTFYLVLSDHNHD